MKFLSVRELQQQGSGIKSILADDGKIIITSNGKPIGLAVGVNEDSLEEVLDDLRMVRQLKHQRLIDQKLDESEELAARADATWIDENVFWGEAGVL